MKKIAVVNTILHVMLKIDQVKEIGHGEVEIKDHEVEVWKSLPEIAES